MTSHEEILERMSSANPLPDTEMITDGQLAELTLLIEDERRNGNVLASEREMVASKYRLRWLRPAAAFGAALLLALAVIGVVSLFTRSEPNIANQPSPVATNPPPQTAPPTSAAIQLNPTNRIMDMVVADGDLWAATLGGVVQWDLASQTHTVHDVSLGLGDGFRRVMAGTDGTLWFEGDGELARFDGSWTTYPPLSEAPFNHVILGDYVALAVGPDGVLWAAVGPAELGRFDGSEWEIIETPYPATLLEQSWASDLAVAPDGTLWAVLQGSSGEPGPESSTLGPGAIASFDGSTWTHYTTAAGLPDGVRAITVAPDGTVWAMSFGWGWADDSGNGGSVSGEGVARFDGDTWTRYTEADGLPSNDSEIVVGLDGSIWAVDIEGSGLSRFEGSSWTILPASRSYQLPAVVDAAGTWWMPSDESGGGIIGVNGEDTIRLIVPTEESAAAAPTASIAPAPDEWNPILADTHAGSTPPATTCPPGASPNEPGPIGQERPGKGFNGMLAGAFDARLGQIIYVDTARETWGFDVCTNTWSNLNPSGTPPAETSAGLVYDADSDLTIAVGSAIGVYDAKANEWSTVGGLLEYPLGAVYDPVSGLVVTTKYIDNDAMELWAYDVDSDTWTLVGFLPQAGDLLGYTPELDRFIAASDNITMLVDPRSGESTIVATETPGVTLGWPKASYGPTTETAFVAYGVKGFGGMIVDVFPGLICGFDPETLTWSTCFPSPGDQAYPGFGAIVGDPINNRLVIINGIYGNFWVNATDHVWGIDLESGELMELLAESG